MAPALQPLPRDLGVLLADMGGPASVAGLEPYLRALLGDPRILRVPLGPLLRPLLARRIARTRAPRVAPRYTAIGGGSPLLAASQRLARGLEELLQRPVGVTMRYTEPRLGPALDALATRGAERLVLIPLYPQYSTSTTASTLDDLAAHRPRGLSVAVVERHADRAAFLDLMAGLLRPFLEAAPGGTRVLFTAHSIPESFTRAGDPYIGEIRQAAAGIARRAGVPEQACSLAFQSAAPRGRWHGPTWEESLMRLHAEGARSLVVQPLSFVSENLETLWDLDHELRSRCGELGISLRRVPTPGTAPGYAALLADLVAEAAAREGWTP